MDEIKAVSVARLNRVPTQLWRPSLSSYPDFVHVVGLQLPQGRPRKAQRALIRGHRRKERTLELIPVVVFNELDQLLLGVRFSWDEDWIIHEGLVKVHLIELQLQSFGHL